MSSAYVVPKGRSVVSVPDPRLNRMIVRDTYRYAALGEYAETAGISVEQTISLLSRVLDSGVAGLEMVRGEVFLLTAPAGRPIPAHLPEIAPNLWEALRAQCGLEEAWSLWRVTRSMERAGWVVEADPALVRGSLDHVLVPPVLGVHVGQVVAPVVVAPTATELASSTGVLAEFDRAGASVVAVACPLGALDATVTAARKWALSQRAVPTELTVMVLEAPRYQPVLLSPGDAAVTPLAVTREHAGDALRLRGR